MQLALYGLGTSRASHPWSAFCAAFAPLQVTEDPNRRETHWTLEHAEYPVRFYAPVSGMFRKSVSTVHFEFEDVAMFAKHDGRLDHPFWTGLFDLLTQWSVLIHMQSTPMGEAIIVGSEHALKQLPSWAESREHFFVAETRAEFDALISEAWDLIARINSGMEPRLGWADAAEHDPDALTAFSNYVAGKRGKVPRHTWVGKAIKVRGSRGSFLDRYGVWVDWRDFDDGIVNYFAQQLREPSLRGEVTDDGIRITFGAATKDLSVEHIGRERYQTIRGLNDILKGSYEIRGVLKEMDSDTHCFLFAPTWLWQHLEEQDRERLDRKIKRIDEEDGFMPSGERGLAR